MIPVSEPDLGSLERQYLLEAFDSGWISSRGAFIERAERLIRSVSGAPHAAVCSNGTTALHLALLAARVGPGDEVILPSLTYVATINAVYYVGAKPVVVDVDDDTWCIDPQAVRAAITPDTAAIIAVDIYGHPANYSALREISDDHDLILVADAAESIGASIEGVQSGSLADISTFSFFGNKVITSGEGGAVTTANEEMHTLICRLRNQGNHLNRRYHHDLVGYNYRMTNLSAAVLTAQLERIDDLLERRRSVVEAYRSLLGAETSVRPQRIGPGALPSPWMHSVRLSGFEATARDQVVTALESAGIESRPVFHPVQHMPFVEPAQRGSTPVAERISREGLSLPTFPALKRSDIEYVVSALTAAVRGVTVASRTGRH